MSKILPLISKKPIKDFLQQYMTATLNEANEYLKTATKLQTMDIEIDGETFEMGYDNNKYFLSTQRRCFFAGNIDNNDYLTTIHNDLEKFGKVILIFKNWDNPKYLDVMLENHYVAVVKEIAYISTYCTLKSDDGSIIFKGRNVK